MSKKRYGVSYLRRMTRRAGLREERALKVRSALGPVWALDYVRELREVKNEVVTYIFGS